MSGPRWHIAFCNVTFADYAGVRYADYYGSPAVMLETQLAAKEYAERRYGVGRFMYPFVDSPACLFGSYLGVPVIEPAEDELAYLDTSRPVMDDVSQYGRVRIGDPRTEGLMGRRWRYWQYYKEHGYETRFGGYGGGVVTIACEISGGAALAGFGENPWWWRRRRLSRGSMRRWRGTSTWGCRTRGMTSRACSRRRCTGASRCRATDGYTQIARAGSCTASC